MEKLKVVVLDMQPITPAVGGGRQRLLGLYHDLGPDIETVYVGSYDWPGEKHRHHMLTDSLKEICVPLSEAHHKAARDTMLSMDGRVMIDIEFSKQAHLSPDYLAEASKHIKRADVVVFSHPWCFPPLANQLREEQLVVYDSQNVESVLRTSLHDDLPQATYLLETVAEAEADLLCRANLILACSHEDRQLFHAIFEAPWSKLRIVPNGIFVQKQEVFDVARKRQQKQDLGAPDKPTAIFLGSGYGPNNAAARYIVSELAPSQPNVHFVMMGGCCEHIAPDVPSNVMLAGVVDDDKKRQWLRASDIALNPLEAGSGTSIKMFDYMAAGLPVIATDIGARGISTCGRQPFLLTDIQRTAEALQRLVENDQLRQSMGADARLVVEELYSWEQISKDLGRLFSKRSGEMKTLKSRPIYSVLVPSFERPVKLKELFDQLARQTFKDFEVIVVDQSAVPWSGRDATWPFKFEYIHTSIRGAVKARNTAAHFASGRILAFTDDDCLPEPGWLENAVKYFEQEDVVGIEGLIRSDHIGDPNWRPVTNVGFEGIGFMTANIMVRNDIFQRLGGFDLSFDCPHFREDTDLGWRMQSVGSVPYAADVVVFHPAQSRNVLRESQAERDRYFEKDALLMAKHPERYPSLFFAECHYQRENFWSSFLLGIRKYGVSVPDWIEDLDEYRPFGNGAATTQLYPR